MNFFLKILLFLQSEMTRPTPYGWFHLLSIFLMLIVIFVLYKRRDKNSQKQLNKVLLIYGVVAFILEVLKQIIWSFNYDPVTFDITWDYQWYAAPFQLCTTPIYVSLLCLFVKNKKIKNALLSYLAFITILGSIATILIPNSCFTETILVNIHTMWLHLGSFVVSIYLLMTGSLEIKLNNLIHGFLVFLIFVFLALFLNIFIYNINILNGETFNMFYISPYFKSELPVFDIVSETMPYVVFLIFYIAVIGVGSTIIYFISKIIKKLNLK